MANARLYPFWGALTEALRTGEPQNEAKQGRDLFDEIYRSPAILSEFLKAMTGLSLGAAHAIAEKFPGMTTRASPTSALHRAVLRSSLPGHIPTSTASGSICRW
jgi:hypothetical protein